MHRWSGRLAFAFTLPVAYHCIFKLGFQDPDARVLAHSLFGCAVYGAFAAKVTILRLHRFPMPVLPVAGGLLFATLIGVWYTSALWLYRQPPRAGSAPRRARFPAAARPAAGARSSRSAGCGACHTLAAAGSHGQIGPNLDRLRPSFAAVQAQVEKGGGGMPVVRVPADAGPDPRRVGVRGHARRLRSTSQAVVGAYDRESKWSRGCSGGGGLRHSRFSSSWRRLQVAASPHASTPGCTFTRSPTRTRATTRSCSSA